LEASPPRQRERAGQWSSAHAAACGGLAAQREDSVTLLVGGDHPGDVARRMARELGGYLGVPVTGGGAGPVAGPQQVPGAYAEAQRCASALLALGRAGDGASAAELGFVDEVIRPRELRRRLCEHLRRLRNKKDEGPKRKHGNIPL